MRNRNTSGLLAAVAAFGLLALLSGCGQPQYHLVGNHTWSAPAPQPKGQGVPQGTGSQNGGGSMSGNTSFSRSH